ncbi:MAG TPA: hypothetical protein DCQ30_01165 [Acidimicrobiaceae bacterium]|nr:hypothetical protein [Acidimicrobiaceae bacterium]
MRFGPEPLVAAGAVIAGGGYCYLAAGTSPFTTEADVVTAVPMAAGGAALVAGLVRRGAAEPGARARLWPWVAALGALALWELATYAAGFPFGRHAFPTVSSLYDEAARLRGLKALCFALWLALGFGLVLPS